jgi:hypothetical protein
MRKALAFAAERTTPTAVTWWFAPFGGFLAACLLWLLGAPVTFGWWLPDNTILRGAFDVLVCVVVAYVVMVLAIAPIQSRLKAGSGTRAVLKQMWPQYLMTIAGCLFFVGFVGFLQKNVEEKPPLKELKAVAPAESRKSAGILLLSTEGKIATRAIEIGDSGLKFNGFNFFGVSKLKVELVDGVAMVSADVRDDKGTLIGEIVQNTWMVKPDKTWDFNYNANALEVKNPQGRIVLQVKVLPDTIQIQGEWWNAQGDGARLLKVPEGGMKIIKFGRDSNPDDDSWPKIEAIFKYPSELYLGKLLGDKSH